jgi:MSHA biogenesis protein MshK
MIAALQATLAVTLVLLLGQGFAQGQGLSDPMQPPALVAPAGTGTGAGESAGGGVLQSTLLSKGRRIAMIDGKPMQVGDRIGEATIVAIDPASVTLREAGATRVLQLYQGVEITSGAAAKAPSSRTSGKTSGKEGTK